MIELLLEVSQGRGAAFLDVVKNRPHQIGGFGSAIAARGIAASNSARDRFLPRRSMIRMMFSLITPYRTNARCRNPPRIAVSPTS